MKIVLDRIEKTQNGNRIFVFDGDKETYNIGENDIPKDIINELKVGMMIETEIIDGKLSSPTLLIDESNDKIDEMNSRLNNLFKRKKQGQ